MPKLDAQLDLRPTFKVSKQTPMIPSPNECSFDDSPLTIQFIRKSAFLLQTLKKLNICAYFLLPRKVSVVGDDDGLYAELHEKIIFVMWLASLLNMVWYLFPTPCQPFK